LNDKEKEIATLDKEISKLSSQYAAKTKTLTAIYDKKVNYNLKSGIFHDIAEDLSKFNVNVETMYGKEDTVWISMVSPSDRKLTEVIQYISDTHFKRIKKIDIKMIQKDPKNNYYKGLLKVELK